MVFSSKLVVLTLFSCFILGCFSSSEGNEDLSPSQENKKEGDLSYAREKKLKDQAVEEEHSYVTCSLLRKDVVEDCDIYSMMCNGQKEFAVFCRRKPMGFITNPPTPVSF